MIKSTFRSTIVVGLLCAVLAITFIEYNVNAQEPITAVEQSIDKEPVEASVEIREGRGQQYEVVITDEKGEEVYRYSDGKYFTQAPIYKELKPSESMQWDDVWDMTDKDGETLTSGKCRAQITVLAGIRDGEIDKSELTTTIEFDLLELVAK